MIQSPLKPRRRITGVYDQSSMHPANAGPAMRQQPPPQDGLPQQRPPMPRNAGLAQRGTARFGGVVSPQQAQGAQPQGPVHGQAQPWGRRMFTGGGGMSMPQADFGGTKPRLVGAGAVPPQTFNAPPPSAWADGSGARSVYDQQGQEGYAAGSVWSSMNPDADVQKISRDPLDRAALAQDFKRRFGAASQASDRLRGELDSRLGALTFEDDSGISGVVDDGAASYFNEPAQEPGLGNASDTGGQGLIADDGSGDVSGVRDTGGRGVTVEEQQAADEARRVEARQTPRPAGMSDEDVEAYLRAGFVVTAEGVFQDVASYVYSKAYQEALDMGRSNAEAKAYAEVEVARRSDRNGRVLEEVDGDLLQRTREDFARDEEYAATTVANAPPEIPEEVRAAYEAVMNQPVPTLDEGAIDEKVAADQAAQAMAEARSMRAMLEMSARAGMSPGAAAAATQAQSMESGIAGVQRDANTRLNLTVRNHEAALRQYDNQIASLMSMAEYLKGTEQGNRALAQAMALANQRGRIEKDLLAYQDQINDDNMWTQVGLTALGGILGAGGSALGSWAGKP